MLAGVCFLCLFTAEAMVFELRRASRERISELGWMLLGTSLTLAFAASFLYAGDRLVAGRQLAGFVLVGVAVAYGRWRSRRRCSAAGMLTSRTSLPGSAWQRWPPRPACCSAAPAWSARGRPSRS